jgi:hypothetical protein
MCWVFGALFATVNDASESVSTGFDPNQQSAHVRITSGSLKSPSASLRRCAVGCEWLSPASRLITKQNFPDSLTAAEHLGRSVLTVRFNALVAETKVLQRC